jgi:hypothetical protein
MNSGGNFQELRMKLNTYLFFNFKLDRLNKPWFFQAKGYTEEIFLGD